MAALQETTLRAYIDSSLTLIEVNESFTTDVNEKKLRPRDSSHRVPVIISMMLACSTSDLALFFKFICLYH